MRQLVFRASPLLPGAGVAANCSAFNVSKKTKRVVAAITAASDAGRLEGCAIPQASVTRGTRASFAKERMAAIHAAARAAGIKCLETQWIGWNQPHRFRCAHGHEWTTRGSDCLHLQHCPACAEGAQATGVKARPFARSWMPKPPTDGDDVLAWMRWDAVHARMQATSQQAMEEGLARMRALAQARGGVCLEEEYRGVGYYRFRCAQGHEWRMQSKRVLTGGWCLLCAAVSAVTQDTSGRAQADAHPTHAASTREPST